MSFIFQVRRLSLYVFIITLLSASLVLYNDSKKQLVLEKNIHNSLFQIEHISKKNGKTYLYSKNSIIYTPHIDEEYISGDVININGRLQNTTSLKNKSYGLYLKSKGFDYFIYAYTISKVNHTTSVNTVLHIIRNNISSTIDILYPTYAGIVKALLISDRELITDNDKMLFSKSGISHIISISGFHIILINSIFLSAFFFLPRNKRFAISSALTLFYVFLTGCQAPCVRAYIFYITFLLSVVFEKKYDIFSVGFLLSSIYIALNPYILFDLGFCLSFMSVFSIAMFYKPTMSFFNKLLSHLPIYDKTIFIYGHCIHFDNIYTPIIQTISLTISAQILTLPYVYYNIGIISFISIISNAISVPIISISFPFMILSLIFSKLPIIREVFSNIVNILLFIFYKSNSIFTSLPFSHMTFENRSFLIVLAFYLILLFAYNIYIRSKIEKNMLID